MTAVYIRNVSRDETRIREIEDLAKAVTAAGSGMVLAADSLAIADHAAELGLIDRQAPARVSAEIDAEGATASKRPARKVARRDLRDAVMGSDGSGGGNGGDAPNVVVGTDRRD